MPYAAADQLRSVCDGQVTASVSDDALAPLGDAYMRTFHLPGLARLDLTSAAGTMQLSSELAAWVAQLCIR